MNKFNFRVAFRLCLLCLATVELTCSAYLQWKASREANQFTPYYAWSTVDPAGEFLSKNRGPLKVQLDPFLGYVLVPNQKSEHFSIGPDGFRQSPNNKSLEDSKLLVVLGGSTAFGTGLSSDDETFASYFSKVIPNTISINAGVPGYTSKHEYASVLWNFDQQKKVSAYVVIDGFNDSTLTLCQRYTDNFQIPEDSLKAYSQLTSSNLIVRALYGATRFIFASTIDVVNQLDSCKFELSPRNFEVAAEKYVQNLRLIRNVARRQGAEFHCFLQPNLYSLKSRLRIEKEEGTELFSLGYEMFRRNVFQQLKKYDVSCQDINDWEIAESMFLDPIHLTADGTALVARKISEEISRNSNQ